MLIQHTKRLLIGAMIFAAVGSAIAAGIGTLPVKTVNGIRYHYYTVQPHETVYALSKRFGLSEKEILKLNPDVADGLKAGEDLLLGKAKIKKGKDTETYKVKKQETAYGISKRFNMTLDEFYELNPQAREGVKDGQKVIVLKNATEKKSDKPMPAKSETKTQTVAGRSHVIADHETLYQIARDNNISLSDLLAANPGLDAARYSAGTTIAIPASAQVTTAADTKPVSNAYQVKSGDTFYGIATRHGVPIAQLYEANPGVDVLKEGMTINLPAGCDEKVEPAKAIAEPHKTTLAVVLPFQLEDHGKHNKNMVEFYRGFLLAVDSLRSMGQPIHILTYDTKGTIDGLKEVLAAPELKNAQAIIAPDNADQLAELNQYGADNKIAILNLFNNRDTAYLTNPFAIQGALPRDDMYRRAAKSFVESFDGFTPVFLVNNDGRKDKMEFIDVVRAELNRSGKAYKEIGYNGTLSLETLNNALGSTTKYAFLPASSHKEEFENIATALQAYKDARDFKNEVVVWGYPEWLANRAAYAKMHNLDSYVYSRTDLPEKYTTEAIDANYQKWYGPGMSVAFPRRAYMGFDAGIFLLKSVSYNGGDFNHGTPFVSSITMPITLKRQPGGGLYNNDLLLINLAPGEIISKRPI